MHREAQNLSLKVMRTWAYSDGENEWNAIQPQLGVLNETILSQVIACTAALTGRRLAPNFYGKVALTSKALAESQLNSLPKDSPEGLGCHFIKWIVVCD